MRITPDATKVVVMIAALLLFAGLGTGTAVAQEEVMSCQDCHEIAETFHANPHVRGTVVDGVIPNAVCESCHGDGTAHMEAGGDPELIVHPIGLTGSNTCLSCHDTSTFWTSKAASVHKNSQDVNCLTCHEIHEPEESETALLTTTQTELCSSCHSTYASELRNKPFGHEVGRGGMECSSCHEPHGRRGDGTLARTRSGEFACMDCHVDKRGPFVFPHGGNEISSDCLSCHELHGSNNPMQLKRANVYQLCTECHSPIAGMVLGSQPPSFHDITSPRFQNCTTCHTAVHGSHRSPALLK